MTKNQIYIIRRQILLYYILKWISFKLLHKGNSYMSAIRLKQNGQVTSIEKAV